MVLTCIALSYCPLEHAHIELTLLAFLTGWEGHHWNLETLGDLDQAYVATCQACSQCTCTSDWANCSRPSWS